MICKRTSYEIHMNIFQTNFIKSSYEVHMNFTKLMWSYCEIQTNFVRNLYEYVSYIWNEFIIISYEFHTNLTHWGRVTHICVDNLTTIGSDNGLSPGRRQAIIWTNAGILLIGPLGTNFSEILTEMITFSFKKMYLKVSSGKWRPFCLGLNVLIWSSYETQKNFGLGHE